MRACRARRTAPSCCTPRPRRPRAGRSRWCATATSIEIDVAKRKLHLHISDAELAQRKAQWKPPPPHTDRGWVKLYCETVLQADEGVDLDFLVGKSGAKVGRPSH